MEESTEKRLEKIEEMVKDNNHLLHKMRRGQIWASIMRTLYWLIILGVSGATYYYLKPVMAQLLEVYSNFGNLF